MKRIVNALGKVNWGKRASAVFALNAMTAIALPAQTFTLLHAFSSTEGNNPRGGFVQTTNGDFYGATFYGGATNNGTIFKVTPQGTLTTLYSVSSPAGSTFLCDEIGFECGTPLVEATNGNLYGASPITGAAGDGTIFKMTLGGTLTTLYNFCSAGGSCPDGAGPTGLILAADGSFYGTSYGTPSSGGVNGTVFKITPGGTLTTLYNFCPAGGSCPDGRGPTALTQATNGDFYGTTYFGGATNNGTIFKITSKAR